MLSKWFLFFLLFLARTAAAASDPLSAVTTSQQEEWAQGPFALQAAGGPSLGGPLDTGGDGVLLYFRGADAGAGTRVLPARWPSASGDLFRPGAPMGGWMVAGSVLVTEATSQAGRPATWLPLEEEDAFFPRLLTANATGVLWMRSLDRLLGPCLLSPMSAERHLFPSGKLSI